MARTTRYELAFNWATQRPTPFTEAISEAARRHRIGVLCVGRGDLELVRRRIEKGRAQIGVFLNTQADGTNLASPSMLLCRAVKARGGLVVEDPDDAPVYADRALQLEYLRRAGFTVPRHTVLESWQRGKAPLSARDRAIVNGTWGAVAGLGLDRRSQVVSTARQVSATLARAGFRSGQKIVLYRHEDAAVEDGRELRFRAWYFYGEIVVVWRRRHAGGFERLGEADAAHESFVRIVAMVRRCAEITGLDWFMTELIVAGTGRKRSLMVVEPPNALAGLGPGVGALSDLGSGIMRQAAERIVEVAWRRGRGLPLPDGTTVTMG